MCSSSMMGGGGGESEPGAQATGDEVTGETPVPPDQGDTTEGGCAPSEDTAWEEFYEWSSAQCWGPNCETSTAEQFHALVAKLRELDLPVEARR